MVLLNRHSLQSFSIALFVVMVSIDITAQEPEDASQHRIAFTVGDEIYLIDGDSNGLERLPSTQLSFAHSLKYSPNGKRIAFLAVGKQDLPTVERYNLAFHAILYTMDATGENLARVTATPLALFEWSPDGSKFLFQSSYDDLRDHGNEGWLSSATYVVNADGTDQQRLTPVQGYDGFAKWSPDGRFIAFTSDRDAQTEIYVMRADGTNTRRLTTSKRGASSPTWSPDGKEIAFAAHRFGMLPTMRLIGADGTNERHVADNARPLAWLPDGKSLLIGDSIQMIDRDGNNRITLAEGVFDAAISPNGKFVYYRAKTNDTWNLYRVDRKGDARIQLTKSERSVRGFAVSPVTGG